MSSRSVGPFDLQDKLGSGGMGIVYRAVEVQEAAEGIPPEPSTPLVDGFDESDPATWGNPSRNDPCPCGSGRKFKHCHGRLA